MIVFDLVGDNEAHPVYQALQVQNQSRQYDFIESVVQAALATQQNFLSTVVIKSLNHQAIACLHAGAGEYRVCPVYVGDPNHKKPTDFTPPAAFRVPTLMDQMINAVNRTWATTDPVVLATHVLWRLNWIHPFVNGNGRTARAAAYYILCISLGGWLPGNVILPQLLLRERDEYVRALQAADASMVKTGQADLAQLHALVTQLLSEQLAPFQSAQPSTPAPSVKPSV